MTCSDEDLRLSYEKLWTNWAFRLSLSSLELFHSNALQYIAELSAESDTSPKLAPGEVSGRTVKALFQLFAPVDDKSMLDVYERAKSNLEAKLKDDAVYSVKREWNDMDLVVLDQTQNAPLFALEVKVKSIATYDQLEGYQNELDKYWQERKGEPFHPPLILVYGIAESKVHDKWPLKIGFSSIATSLAELNEKLNNELCRTYAELCCELGRIVACFREQIGPETQWKRLNELENDARPYRLAPVVSKLFFEKLAEVCRRKLEDDPRVASIKGYLECASGYTNDGQVNVGWRFGSEKGSEPSLFLGIQVESASFRFCASVRDRALSNESSPRKCVEGTLIKLVELGIFDSNPALDSIKKRWKKSSSELNGTRERIKKIQSADGDPNVKRKQLDDLEAKAEDLRFWSSIPEVSWGKSSESCEMLTMEGVGSPRHQKAKDGGKPPLGKPLLHGYRNSEVSGFADFRCKVSPSTTIDKLADLIRDVLLQGKYSSAQSLSPRDPILVKAIQCFERSPNKMEWSIAPKLDIQAPRSPE